MPKPAPTPWLVVQGLIGKDWGMPPFAVPHWGDHADPLSDAVGRWIEVSNLKGKYPLGWGG